jgi:hypothetical protein
LIATKLLSAMIVSSFIRSQSFTAAAAMSWGVEDSGTGTKYTVEPAAGFDFLLMMGSAQWLRQKIAIRC